MTPKAIPLIVTLLVLVASCQRPPTPKPRGYFRIDLPAKDYVMLDSLLPYSFEYPVYSRVEPDIGPNSEPYWINLYFPEFRARVHITYRQVDGNLYSLLEDNMRFTFNHSVKADAINEQVFENPADNVYGMLFEVHGNAASPVQFFVTDSIRHFLRGSLYFKVMPNQDSLAPVVEFITEDIVRIIETTRWTN